MAGDIIVVGSINLDMVVCAPRIPGPGENVCGTEFRMIPGGKGANQAVAATRLGNRTFLLGRVGDDNFGEFLIGNLDSAGVETSLVGRTVGRATGVALIVVEEGTGVNTIVVEPGANMSLIPGDLDALEPYYEDASAVVFQLEIPIEVVKEGASRASSRGVTTLLDAGPPRGVDISALEDFALVSPNQDELSDITGKEVVDPVTAAAAAWDLIEAGIPRVVVKMGGSGAVLVEETGSWHIPAFRVQALDSTAAGDAFTAALATAVSEGMDMIPAVIFANAAGAVAVTSMGAQPSMPSREQMEDLMDSQVIEWSSL